MAINIEVIWYYEYYFINFFNNCELMIYIYITHVVQGSVAIRFCGYNYRKITTKNKFRQ